VTLTALSDVYGERTKVPVVLAFERAGPIALEVTASQRR
jgi:hypothetical protein